uniref:Podocin n=1 Tax=Stegastes partitus TaxID=144197 RepID=A0A3B4ZJZ3_9TELE
EPPASMEKSSNVQPNHSPRSRAVPRKERDRGALVPPRGQRQRAAKARRLPEAPAERKERLQKEKPETNEVQETEVKLKPAVVDIDSVREDEVKEENLGLLEAAEQEDGELKTEEEPVVLHVSLTLYSSVASVHTHRLTEGCHFGLQVVREHERAVIFRLGHLLRGKPRGPGLIFYLPLLDVCHKVDIRLKMLKVPPHMVVTKDLVRPELSAVCYYQIENLALCSAALSSLITVLQNVVQAAVRDVVAQHTFSHILLHRRRIGEQIQAAADSVVCRWGIRVERADICVCILKKTKKKKTCFSSAGPSSLQVKAAESELAAWDGFRASLRLLHPALVLPLPPDLLNLNSDLASLPPPPPPAVEGEAEEEPETDSPMM